jgi:hypothetical protein
MGLVYPLPGLLFSVLRAHSDPLLLDADTASLHGTLLLLKRPETVCDGHMQSSVSDGHVARCVCLCTSMCMCVRMRMCMLACVPSSSHASGCGCVRACVRAFECQSACVGVLCACPRVSVCPLVRARVRMRVPPRLRAGG